MQYAIVYSSRTGNTAQLARVVKEVCPWESCVYFGDAASAPEQAKKAPLIFVGFWTDRGSCDMQTAQFLKGLTGSSLFLFGSAGYGASETYYDRILEAADQHIGPSNRLVGTFMCPGRMPSAVRRKYVKMLEEEPQAEQIRQMIENYDRSAAHPDAGDLDRLRESVRKALEKIKE